MNKGVVDRKLDILVSGYSAILRLAFASSKLCTFDAVVSEGDLLPHHLAARGANMER